VANHITVTALPPDCHTLPDGRVLTAALVGMEDNRFGSMFLNGIQVCCASGSSCNVHPNAAPVEESFHCCMNCALKFHLCITCSGCCFGDWFLGVTEGGLSKSMHSQYGQEKFDHYNNDLSSSPLKLCSYCKSSLSLSMDALCSSAAATTLAKASCSSATATTLAEEVNVSNDASGNNHNSITTTSIACADMDGILDLKKRSKNCFVPSVDLMHDCIYKPIGVN
jgi:hypothetical protein